MKLYYVAMTIKDAKKTSNIFSTLKDARKLRRNYPETLHIYKADSFQPKYRRTFTKIE